MAETIVITDQNFHQDVLNSDKPVLLDFWAEWCGPCHAIAPILQEIAAEYSAKLVIGKMDVDENPMMPERYSIRSIPTLMLFKKGEVVARITGVRPKEAIMAQVLPHMN